AGIYGIEHELTAPPAFGGNAYEDDRFERVPASLGEAADKLDRSDRARQIFGDDVIDHYVLHARHEEQAYRDQVTAWELNRYFARI
ncbi:MAG: glutamine synthetase, partial [Spirochaetaceae bacterium]|nr:glutamine synthetase [Spirochaetaceae bacterium]